MLDEVEEELQGNIRIPTRSSDLTLSDESEPEPHSRALGLVVLRGPTITLLSPVDGSEEIANPFIAQE